MNYKRSSGIILHPTSLPGPDGIGDLGPEAFRWVNFLANSGCELWQVLPLGPTGYGDSPYQCFSAFAGNPYLISPTLLLDDGLLSRTDLSDRPNFPSDTVDFGQAINWKLTLLDRAFKAFRNGVFPELNLEFEHFQTNSQEWLHDFALFLSIKGSENGASWDKWPSPLRKREGSALQDFARQHIDDILRHKFRQFLFFRQWSRLRAFAVEKGLKIIGDIPIFVAYDSADAWSNPQLFHLDEKGLPTVIAGVPPDYFSPTGQLWGNPLYNWDIHQKEGFSWWIKRIQATLKLVDIIRLDHFRGFAGYWEVPFGNLTAEIGCWAPGPGNTFFEAIQAALGDLPLIAEDLGEITPDVVTLRKKFHLPGMKILQFAFSTSPNDPFLPHNYPENCVTYTGTHDNDTVRGWYETAPEKERDFCRRYLGRSGEDISWDMIRAVWSSVAVMALSPLQDLLSLDTTARMNFPGKASGNWSWRIPPNALTPSLNKRLQEMNFLYSRTSK
jgi:4-alpha-glucanotransferase